MTRLMPLLALLALGGCASVTKVNDRMASSFIGQPAASLTALYGPPFIYGPHGQWYSWRAYRDSYGSLGTAFGTISSTVSGTVDGVPFVGTVTQPSPQNVTTHRCDMDVIVDQDKRVVSLKVSGDPAACRKFS